MKSKEEILFTYMDEVLQVSTENQLRAMEEYADEKILAFLIWKDKHNSKYELRRVIEQFNNEMINDDMPF